MFRESVVGGLVWRPCLSVLPVCRLRCVLRLGRLLLCRGLALSAHWAHWARRQIFLPLDPFLAFLEVGEMHVQGRVRHADFPCEQYHRERHAQDCAKEHLACQPGVLEIDGYERPECEYEGERGKSLAHPDKPKPMSQLANLLDESLPVAFRDVRFVDHLVMEMPYQLGDHGVSVAEIDHHQRYGRKHHSKEYDVVYVIEHDLSLCCAS